MCRQDSANAQLHAILTALEEAPVADRTPAASSTERPRAHSSAQLLARRREALVRFAERVLHQSPMGISSLRSSAPDVDSMGTLSTEAPAKQYQILESLGALIVDAADIDRVGFQSAGFGTVLDNVRVPRAVPLDFGPPMAKRRCAMATVFKRGRVDRDSLPVMLAGVECMVEGHSFPDALPGASGQCCHLGSAGTE